MTARGNGQPEFFKVDYAAHLKDQIKTLHRQAASQGKGQQFIAALRAIWHRLQKDPKEFGESLFRLPLLGLTIFVAVVLPIVVDYAVHDDKPLVFIQGLKILE